MSQPFIGEIRMFAGNFAPAGWALCSGQLLAIAENEALFNLIGTTYGGDGQESFALPDLQGRIPIHQGTASGSGINYQLGDRGGEERVTLTAQQMPLHQHPLASAQPPTSGSPAGHAFGAPPAVKLYTEADGIADLEGNQPVGGSQPHDNTMPYLAVNFIISLFGIFPTQS